MGQGLEHEHGLREARWPSTDSHAAQAHGRAGDGDAHRTGPLAREPGPRAVASAPGARGVLRVASRASCAARSTTRAGSCSSRAPGSRSSAGSPSSSTGGTGRSSCIRAIARASNEILDRVRCRRGLASATSTCGSPLPAGGHRLTCWTFVAGSGTDSILGLGRDAHGPADASRDETPSVCLERRNADLAARLEELEDRYAAVERFAGTAAHQLAEPLVIAESSAILVADELGEDLDPLLRDRLDAIGRGAARARRLMDALLADARTGGTTPAARPGRPALGRRRDAREPRAADRGAQGSRRGRAAPARPGRSRACSRSCSTTSCPTRSSTVRAATAAWRSRPSAVPIAGASRCRAAACRSPRRRPSASSSRSTACRASGGCRASAWG